MLDGNYRKDYTTNSVPVMDLLPSDRRTMRNKQLIILDGDLK
jgi:hypothetical protein